MTGDRFCHGHHPDRAQERVRIASQGGRARSRPAPDFAWSDIGEEEQAARNKAVARESTSAAALDALINTRAKQVKDDPPSFAIDRQRAQDAETRRAWADHHRRMAEIHCATLMDLIAHHEAAAERLVPGTGGG
jgi:hypothetical protein